MSKGRIENLKEDFWEFVQQEVAVNILKKFHSVKQNDEEDSNTTETAYEMDDFAEEVLKCIDGMPVHEVSPILILYALVLGISTNFSTIMIAALKISG